MHAVLITAKGSGAVHIDVTCSGSEPNITSCTSQFNTIAGRSHSDDVGVECQQGQHTFIHCGD